MPSASQSASTCHICSTPLGWAAKFGKTEMAELRVRLQQESTTAAQTRTLQSLQQ